MMFDVDVDAGGVIELKCGDGFKGVSGSDLILLMRS